MHTLNILCTQIAQATLSFSHQSLSPRGLPLRAAASALWDFLCCVCCLAAALFGERYKRFSKRVRRSAGSDLGVYANTSCNRGFDCRLQQCTVKAIIDNIKNVILRDPNVAYTSIALEFKTGIKARRITTRSVLLGGQTEG